MNTNIDTITIPVRLDAATFRSFVNTKQFL